MSELEGEAKPLLMPMMFGDFPTVERSPDEQEIIATWAMKTALVADFFTTRRNFAAHLAADLYQTKRPPPRSYVYMAAYQGVKMPLRSYLFVTKMTFPVAYTPVGVVEQKPTVFDASVATLCVFHLVLQIIVLHQGDHAPLGPPNTSPWLRRLWPRMRDNAVFPPAGDALDDSGLEAFARLSGPIQRIPHIKRRPDDPTVL
jgi:hypothetical protein